MRGHADRQTDGGRAVKRQERAWEPMGTKRENAEVAGQSFYMYPMPDAFYGNRK